jgi:glycosyltransferase involved in cell wall biosynthesis
MPLVTVIMSAYQASATLRRAVASVKSQVFRDWELIVVNDGSTDATGCLAQQCAQNDARIRVINLERNAGPAAARNQAWRQSQSPFLAVLDADDVALPERLSAQVEYLLTCSTVSVLGSGAYFVDLGGRFLRTVIPPAHHAELVRSRWHISPFIHSTVMMRREFLDGTSGYQEDLRLVEDYDLWMRGAQRNEFVYANLPKPLIIYRTPSVQRWSTIRASASIRTRIARREGRWWRGAGAALRVLAEGIVEQSGLFAWRDRCWRKETPPSVAGQLGELRA